MKKIREHFKNSGFILLLICLFALLIRVSFFVALKPWDEQVEKDKVIVGDAEGYHNLALNIMVTRSFSDFGSWRTPGYPLFIAFIYLLFGTKPWIVLFFQLFLDTGMVIIVYFIAKKIFKSKPVPLIAAFLYSISFLSAYYSIRFLTEIPFTFVFATGILIFVRALKKNEIWGFALSGFFIGLATLIRPIAYYFPFAMLLILLFTNKKFRNILILFIIFFMTVSPWQLRNLRTYGYYAVSSIGGQALYDCITATEANIKKISRAEAEQELSWYEELSEVTNLFEKEKMVKRIFFSYIINHPLQYAKYHLMGIIRMFFGTGRVGISDLFGIKAEPFALTDGISDTAHKIIKNFRNELPTLILLIKLMLECIFLVIGLIIMCLKNKKLFSFLLIITIFYFLALTGPVGYSRFRVPIIPFYLIISAKGIFETFKFIETKKRAHHIPPRDV